jgi:MATE family multidrug resistance protein
MEVTGAALASVVSQWVGAMAVVTVTVRRLGWPARLRLGELGQLAAIGRDLFLRTASLNLFLLVTTRVATEGGADVGAAHQGIRQVWVFTALFLDAFAIAGQSLVAYFLGAGQQSECRRVAAVVCQWSLGAGGLLMAAMFLGRDLAAVALIPPASHAVFFSAWSVAALSQPVNALSFATDGIHWGTGDFRYLRNAVIVATVIGLAGLTRVDASASTVLFQIWIVTLGWTTIRAAFGMLRIWPGWGRAPLAVTGPDGNESKN